MSTAQSTAFCELTESGDRIEVYFQFNRTLKDAVKQIPGKRFHNAAESVNGPHWSVPASIENARKLREIFGEGMELGEAIRRWGHLQVGNQQRRNSLGVANDYPLDKLSIAKTHPELARYLRPYQRADVALMAESNMLNTNQPGTGKTVEVLAALAEAGLTEGAHLVVAPVRSLENVWRIEIERWMPGTVYTAEGRAERVEAVREGIAAAKRGETVWILCNVEMIRPRKLKASENPADHDLLKINDYKGGHYVARDDLQAELLTIDWTSYTMDEFHKWGLRSRDSLTTWGSSVIGAKRRYLLSGTPMGGIPATLFAPLRDVEPKKFSSFWRWAGEWLEVTEQVNPYAGGGIVREVGNIKPGTDAKFYEAHAQHMVRRLKREALPGLPAKTRVVVPCDMTPKQRRQYEQFEADAEVTINGTEGDQTVIATCVLAEFSRLKQFANAYCTLNAKGEVAPTTDSGKLPVLLDKLGEFGIAKVNSKQPVHEPGARAIVASQSERMASMVSDYLEAQGIACGLLTGKTKASKPIIDRFQGDDDAPYVIVMTTQTGGVSLNLEKTSSVHILDESWNPDDEEQLEDRGDRGSRETSLVCLYYRTTGTVQEYIAKVALGKQINNRNVLDLYRQVKRGDK
jgi:SNF2 family DNA or RNA helicase